MSKIFVKVLLPKDNLFPLEYMLKDGVHVNIGSFVIVPLRKDLVLGIVISIFNTSSLRSVKFVESIVDDVDCISELQITFMQKAADYYMASLGSIMKLAVPLNFLKTKQKTEKNAYEKPDISNVDLPPLSILQQEALAEIRNTKIPVVINGVTGSGKTEIYFYAILDYLKQNKQVLLMLPEIALGVQLIQRFEKRFGFKVAIWNSNVTALNKKKILNGIISGEILMIIGTRSALFLPYKNLALIVVDEEHDQSYKQSDKVPYNARDMAILRSSIFGSKIILVSATPSIETLNNASSLKYKMLRIENQFHKVEAPEIEIVDMRNLKGGRKKNVLSDRLIELLKQNIENKEQSLLFLNRRGYAPLLFCTACGYRFMCEFCSTSLVFHKSSNCLRCHRCGFTAEVSKSCGSCKSTDLVLCGVGVEKLAESISEIFPNQKIAIFSKDQVKDSSSIENILQEILLGKVDILIATQIVSKGYHFPNLTFAGIVDADIGFFGGDLKSTETTYQMLYQLCGRVGREKKRGKVVIQTYYPENSMLLALKDGRIGEFIKDEIQNRKDSDMPPFSKAVSISILGKDKDFTFNFAKKIVTVAIKTDGVEIFGPVDGILYKFCNTYVYKILVIAKRSFNIQKYVLSWLNSIKVPSKCRIKLDVDPYSFL